MSLSVIPVEGMGWVQPGDDLAALITDAAPWLRDGDILVVTSKIVSKAEGQLVDIPPLGPARDAARLSALATQTARVVARRGTLHIVQTHHGYVMAAAGIDNSNVEQDRLVLLPKDPDASARLLRSALRTRFGLDVAIIISDTMGRTWRTGLTDVALGSAGIDPMLDHRGQVDPWGNDLRITEMAVVDELASAADLVKRKCDQVPVAVIRGYLSTPVADAAGARTLVRDIDEDMFSLGTAEAIALGLRQAATLPAPPAFRPIPAPAAPVPTAPVPVAPGPTDPGPTDPGPVAPGPVDATPPAALAAAPPALDLAPTSRLTTVPPVEGAPPGTAYLVLASATSPDPGAVLALGMDVQRLRAALAADGLASILTSIRIEGALAVLAVGALP